MIFEGMKWLECPSCFVYEKCVLHLQLHYAVEEERKMVSAVREGKQTQVFKDMVSTGDIPTCMNLTLMRHIPSVIDSIFLINH